MFTPLKKICWSRLQTDKHVVTNNDTQWERLAKVSLAMSEAAVRAELAGAEGVASAQLRLVHALCAAELLLAMREIAMFVLASATREIRAEAGLCEIWHALKFFWCVRELACLAMSTAALLMETAHLSLSQRWCTAAWNRNRRLLAACRGCASVGRSQGQPQGARQVICGALHAATVHRQEGKFREQALLLHLESQALQDSSLSNCGVAEQRSRKTRWRVLLESWWQHQGFSALHVLFPGRIGM